ncbi:MAG TPA: DNA repair protein RecN [Longimicrobiales bacterium]|nr:DNA repair protein RecN [Longimicrobiales bacterium]
MLTELRIQDYAVIDRLAIRLGPGLNALTGETGAGKSIIVGALSLIIGERASSDVVRTGADRAIVEAVFDIAGMEPVIGMLGQRGIETEDDLLIIRREISAAGRSRVWVNGAASTVSLLGELGSALVDLHGQHEHQSLLQPAQQRALLDAYADALDLARTVRGEHERLRNARARLEDLESRVRTAEQRADFLRFQLEEIDRAKIRAGEEEELETEANRLSHAAELSELAESLHVELYAGERAVSARLADVRRTLDHLTRIDPSLQQWRETVENALFGLEEMGRVMGEYSSSIEHDPARLDNLRRRQDMLFRLKRKYGPELEDVIRTASDARSELEALESSVLDREAIEREIADADRALQAAAARLTAARRKGSKQLGSAIAAVLPDLGMTGARFRVELVPLPEPGAHGAEDVEFLIAVNAGFEPKPLSRVASGGEMSRIMLALKTELARLDGIPTLVFDEIDAGIGGRVANQVGDKLKRVAEGHQVFVITHLPQIASRADTHLLVLKADRKGITATDVQPLDGGERVRELARLLGGDPESEVSIEHARELLGSA